MKQGIVAVAVLLAMLPDPVQSQSLAISDKDDRFNWIQTARVFLLDAYQPPFAPVLEYDAEVFAETMADMHANVARIGTMGKYATIQGTRFSTHPDQSGRDLLSETIRACKPRGIKVIPYISTGHKLAWSMVTGDYPEYAQKATPNGLPCRSHMYVGEDHGTVCWMTPYREAFLDYVEHVVRDYDIDGIYFDAWNPHYFWEGKKVCYCEGCQKGFRETTGLEIPYHEKNEDYTREELSAIEKYHDWYKEEYLNNVVLKVRELVKSYKDIPMISNINNPEKMASLDPRIINSMDAFLYERGRTILERAEGVSVPRSIGMHVWPYVGVYHNWPRLAFQGINYQQEIFTNLMFGGGSIIAQPTGYQDHTEHRQYVRFPFGLIETHEEKLEGLENYPYTGVVFAYKSPVNHEQNSWNEGITDSRTSSLGAFSACLYQHLQVSSISEFVLDDPKKLHKYPVLYLANLPYLSDERIRNITGYVRDGGSLIASYGTTVYDKNGHRRETFGLEDLIHVKPLIPEGELAGIISSHRAMIGGPNDLYLKSRTGKNVIPDESPESRLFPLWFYEPVEVLEGGEVIMDIVTGHDQQPVLPGVVLSRYGKGKVIYCTSALESLYQAGGQDLVGALIKKLIGIVAPEPAPYRLEAPASLLANLTKAENRMVLQLTNWTGNKFEQPQKNEYYLSPVEDVRLQIRIPENKKVTRVSTLVKTNYRKKITGQYVDVFFPRIESYQAVLVELE